MLQLKDEDALPFDPATFTRPKTGGAVNPTDAAKVEAAMKAFCGLYDEANVDAVPDVLAENFYEVSAGSCSPNCQPMCKLTLGHQRPMRCRTRERGPFFICCSGALPLV